MKLNITPHVRDSDIRLIAIARPTTNPVVIKTPKGKN